MSSLDNSNQDSPESFDKAWWFDFQRQLCDEIIEITHQKNNDYTGGNASSNPFANFDSSVDFGIHPVVGLCVRMSDKFQRAKTFAKDGKLAFTGDNDTVRDIFLDIVGYSLIVMGMLERDKRQGLVSTNEFMS